MNFATTAETLPDPVNPKIPDALRENFSRFSKLPREKMEKLVGKMSPKMRDLLKGVENAAKNSIVEAKSVEAGAEHKSALQEVLADVSEFLKSAPEKVWDGIKFVAELPLKVWHALDAIPMAKPAITLLLFLGVAYFGTSAFLSLLKISPKAALSNVQSMFSSVLPAVGSSGASAIPPDAAAIAAKNAFEYIQ